MKNQLFIIWCRVRDSLWFVPGLMVAGALALAYGVTNLDAVLGPVIGEDSWWIYQGTPAGVRAVFSTIAGSMITVAGLVFSLTMVVLNLTSNQFGPRLVRNFMDDRGNQLVLGTFVATFVFCLVALRTIVGSDEYARPNLSVTVGLVMALASLGVLIYFIHHIASSIQAGNLVARVARDLDASVRRLYPEAGSGPDPGPPPELPPGFAQRAGILWAHKSGYVQMIDQERLYSLARELDLLIQVKLRPGDFAIQGNPLALVWPPESLKPALAVRLHRCFTLGVERTDVQDVEYVARLLTETALRALSPGVNDPFTALSCIDWLGSGLALMARRDRRTPYRLGPDGAIRLINPEVNFSRVAEGSLGPIRRAARENVMCTARLLEMLAALALQVRHAGDHRVLLRQAEAVKTDSLDNLKLAWDRDLISQKHQAALEALGQAELRLEKPTG